MAHTVTETPMMEESSEQQLQRAWAPNKDALGHIQRLESLKSRINWFKPGPNVSKSLSFKIPRDTKQEIPSYSEEHDGRGPSIESNSSNTVVPDTSNPQISDIPKPLTRLKLVPSKKASLLRAATFRVGSWLPPTSQTKLTGAHSSSTPSPKSDTLNSSLTSTEKFPLDALKFRIQPGFRQPANYVDFTSFIRHYEEKVYNKVQDFPSVRLQQTKGPNYTSSWNWMSQLRKIEKEWTEGKTSFSLDDVKDISERLEAFYWQVSTVQSIISKIRLNFECGLENLDDSDERSIVQTLGKDFQRCRLTGPTLSTLSDGAKTYIQDIFRNEKRKQEKYEVWMSRNLTSPMHCKKRNDLAKWVLSTASRLRYTAETAHIAIYMIDAFLNVKGTQLSLHGWGLLAIAALQIAGKMEEPEAVPTSRLIRLSGQFYQNHEVSAMEGRILSKLNFDTNPPLATVFAQTVLLGGSLEISNSNIKRLIMDLCLGILYKSLESHKYFRIRPMDKAKAALEIAVEFVFFQHKLYSGRDMQRYDCAASEPGKEIGEFALTLCFELFRQRFIHFSEKIPKLNISSVHCTASPVREINAS